MALRSADTTSIIVCLSPLSISIDITVPAGPAFHINLNNSLKATGTTPFILFIISPALIPARAAGDEL